MTGTPLLKSSVAVKTKFLATINWQALKQLCSWHLENNKGMLIAIYWGKDLDVAPASFSDVDGNYEASGFFWDHKLQNYKVILKIIFWSYTREVDDFNNFLWGGLGRVPGVLSIVGDLIRREKRRTNNYESQSYEKDLPLSPLSQFKCSL